MLEHSRQLVKPISEYGSILELTKKTKKTMRSKALKKFVVRFSGTVKKSHEYGGVAQLGEHLPCKQGVKGSIPFISTIADT